MITILSFILTIGILVIVHEFGHFQVAKWCNVKVLKFSIGFGRPLLKKTIGKDKTQLIIAAIPLGGYVKMLDERELANESSDNLDKITAEDLPRAFNRKTVWQRIAIVLAGPIANLLLAILIYWVMFMMGQQGLKPIVGDLKKDGIAQLAGLQKGDLIQKVDNFQVKTWQEARWQMLESSLEKKTIVLEVARNEHVLVRSNLAIASIDQNQEIDIIDKLGLSPFKPIFPAEIGEVLTGSVAESVGLKVGDKLLKVNSISISDWDSLVKIIKNNPKKQLTVDLIRNQQLLKLNLTPDSKQLQGKEIGFIGAGPLIDKSLEKNYIVELKYNALESFSHAVKKTWQTSTFSLKMLWQMLTGKTSWKGISGPGTIASFAGESASLGFSVYFGFLALVSISIGVLNLLPIPMLDGGHLMYYIVEIIKGSPVSEQVMATGQKIGMGILGLLMMVAILNDINRFFVGI
jgi:regulator of sigma E protease